MKSQKIYQKKSQFAVEFVFLLTLILVIFLGFLGVITSKITESEEILETRAVENMADLVINEMEIAKTSKSGYERVFVIPDKIKGKNYTIKIIENRELVIEYLGLEYVRFLPQNIDGNISTGWNCVQREGNIIHFNSDINISEYKEPIPSPPPSISDIILNIIEGTEILKFDDAGNAILKGTLIQNTNPTPTADDEFIIKNSAGNIIFLANLVSSEIQIKGSLFEEEYELNPSPAENNILIKNDMNYLVSYIDESGNIYIKGVLIEP